MGIQGLLGMLKEASVPQHISTWKGKSLAVDAYVWLHRGAYGCAKELALGQTTVKYVNYAINRVRMLKHHGITPLIVFDGGLLPSKMGTEDERERRRTEALAKGVALLAEGQESRARDYFVKAVDVTPEMAYQLIKALRQEGVQYIVAPYEADPQLAYLERKGIVDGIITEDSDLLVFGCRNVLFKLDGDGQCVGVSRDDFTQCREYNFAGWTEKEFRQMAILSGCDYLESIPGVGLKTAYRLMRKYKTAEKVIQYLRLEGQLKVPKTYPAEFKRAELTFLHQRVWDPLLQQLVHFTEVPEGVNPEVEWPFVGAPLEQEYARQLSNGEVDPLSKLPMVDVNPQAFTSAKSERYPPTSSSKKGKKAAAPPPTGTKGTILNFFAPASASQSTPKPASALKKKEEKGPESVPMQREEGGFKSKFFGGGGGGKGKAKEVVVVEDEEEERVRVEVVEVLSGGESDVDLEVEGQDEFRGLGQDEGAGAGEGEGEGAAAPPPPLSVMSEEELVLRDHWHEGLLSEDGSPLPPLPPLPLGVELEMEMEVDRAPQVASSCGGISSPGSSPVRSAGAGRRKMRGGAGVGAIREEEEEDEDDDDDEMEVESAVVAVEKVEKVERGFDEGRSEVTSECGLSSPGGGGLEEEEEVEADEGDDDGLSSPSASPTTVKVAVKAEVRVKQEAAVVVKQETGGKKSASAVAYVELSSDPIDLSSDMIIEEQEQGEATPRPLKSKVEPTSSGGSLGGKGGKKSTSSATTKKRPSQVLQDDEEEETEAKEAVVASVAAAWKAKYMMNAGTSKSPKLTPSSTTARRSLPTPITSRIKPPLTRHPAIKPRPSFSTSLSTPNIVTSRIPLSPRSTNRRTPFVLAGTSSPPSPKKQKPTAQENFGGGASASAPPATVSRTSSSPVVITNPRLLAFKYGGAAVNKL